MRISIIWTSILSCTGILCCAASAIAAPPPTTDSVAAKVDRLVWQAEGATPPAPVDDATFLRRISFDIAGRPASPPQIAWFEDDDSADKRADAVARLLAADYYGENWSRYWKDAILLRATNERAGIVRPLFETWMADSLAQGRGWDAIATDLLTATGSISDDGATALMFAHEGQAEEIAAEASRLFLGVQIQCANCHDHPWDRWKREQFHELAAFFPRVSVRRDPDSDRRIDFIVTSFDRDPRQNRGLNRALLIRIDRNRDNVIAEAEAKGTRLERLFNDRIRTVIDKDGNGELSIQEILTAELPNANRPGRGATEHFMADLADPASQGTRIDPAFFLNGQSLPAGQADQERRQAAADLITAPDNIWFARAIVNRMWSEMTGTAFYSPVDDIGPDRTAVHEDALAVLCDGFVANGHDLKWLIRTIAATQIYQRPMNTEAEGFLRCEPTRLRADQLYDAVCQALGTTRLELQYTGGRRAAYGGQDVDRGRLQFATTFGFDPSTPQADLTGGIPETLFLMNSRELRPLMSAGSTGSMVRRILTEAADDRAAVQQVYLRILGRRPSDAEVNICLTYVSDVGNRDQAFEDLFWSLLNSSEFLCKR